MADFDIRSQSAHTIQNADVINNFPAPPSIDVVERGLNALANRDYAVARKCFDEAVREGGYHDADLIFYQAISTLGGVRPLRHAKATIVAVIDGLSSAGGNATALTLKALVADDYAQNWRRRNEIPATALDVIRAVPRARAGEIVRHVPAPESDIWQILKSRSI